MALSKVSRMLTKQPKRRVKVFGERNTGTRAVIHMLLAHKEVTKGFANAKMPEIQRLENHINEKLEGYSKSLFMDALEDIRCSKLPAHSAWKHAAPIVDESYASKNASVLFLVRDPYSWIVALYRNPYHSRAPLPETLAAFIEQPWLTVKRENIAPILMSPIELWNLKLRAYRDFAAAAPVPSAVLHFEAFVLDPVGELSGALQEFKIPTKGLAEIEEPTKKLGSGRRARQKYYRTKAWEKEISSEAARLINDCVDWDIAAYFGYHRRDPAEFKAKS